MSRVAVIFGDLFAGIAAVALLVTLLGGTPVLWCITAIALGLGGHVYHRIYRHMLTSRDDTIARQRNRIADLTGEQFRLTAQLRKAGR